MLIIPPTKPTGGIVKYIYTVIHTDNYNNITDTDSCEDNNTYNKTIN